MRDIMKYSICNPDMKHIGVVKLLVPKNANISDLDCDRNN